MKSLIFLADGMADEPLKELGGKTPLEAVDTPYMDSIAKQGVNGTFLTLPGHLPTSSDVANMSVLGFKPEENYPGRGPIEAVSQNIEMAPTDVVWRCNLITASPDRILLDYSCGHIENEDSQKFMADLQKEFGSDKVTFHSGVSYRNLLVLHGKEFSPNIDFYKPDSSQDMPISKLGMTPRDNSKEAKYTIDFLNDLSRRVNEYLLKHPMNVGRKSPATDIWPWSPGYSPNLMPFSERYKGKKGAIISAVDVIKGLGKCTNMTVIEVPGATGFLDTNYAGKVEAALEALKSHDFVYLHVEAIDECSHMGNLEKKMQAISDFENKIVAPVLKALEGEEMRFAILPDHPVPIELRIHTRTPVPLAICGAGIEPDNIEVYSETKAPKGSLGMLKQDQLMKILLGLDK